MNSNKDCKELIWVSCWFESPVVNRILSFIGICTQRIRQRISGLGHADAGFTDGHGLRDSSIHRLYTTVDLLTDQLWIRLFFDQISGDLIVKMGKWSE
ncbi:hypothetical protein T4B_9820 [Trichinella pseudospiralis]|uniref:Uncharacterized protein n=1 Tax=Trichinella pseudospiralis TaxID=6337 RepID=A0A0V1KEM1_TRIPS|nr:hypothetical protein T4A_4175 [Trichinella pseudospiralis]KRZ34514.1 hypothetical protein T4B_9820 [Trichinella pseudospiralis]KRZ45269.1 hypothetical protein T4C_10381 [Trichinella pseudospiralis]